VHREGLDDIRFVLEKGLRDNGGAVLAFVENLASFIPVPAGRAGRGREGGKAASEGPEEAAGG
jgi:hypothetical protein